MYNVTIIGSNCTAKAPDGYVQEIKGELARTDSSDRGFLREILNECFKEEMI